jgi:formylglycine-generating enzyme required for sulfatase activity
LSGMQNVFANNLSVSNAGLIGKDISAGTNHPSNFAYVKFDINWENSWRTSSVPSNWDAAWVFVKYHVSTGEWKHATLHTSGHSVPSGAALTTSSDGKGVYIYRAANGTGSVNYSHIKLRWDYAADGVLDSAQVTVKVLAIEMVYVPQGSFHVGTGGTESGSFTNGSWRSGATIKLQITSENPLKIDSSAGSLWGTSTLGDNTIGDTGMVAAGFPKGYSAFYCMKYSITQGQYVDFLNMLTYSQQVSRTAVLPNSTAFTKAMFTAGQFQHRNGIEIQTPGAASSTPAIYGCDLTDNDTLNQVNDGRYVECNYLCWADGCAYADWAALRPMTELEFEKACRGTVDTSTVEQNEFVWGNSSAERDTNITSGGMNNEDVIPAIANVNYYNVSGIVEGPLRAGIFARSTTTQTQAGASYYGIMDMGGGLWERAVTVGNTTGRLFTGSHGDGVLDAAGNASNVNDWPGANAVGAGFRGGVWDSFGLDMQLSSRVVAAYTSSIRPGNTPFDNAGTRGFRAVRTAQE